MEFNQHPALFSTNQQVKPRPLTSPFVFLAVLDAFIMKMSPLPHLTLHSMSIHMIFLKSLVAGVIAFPFQLAATGAVFRSEAAAATQ